MQANYQNVTLTGGFWKAKEDLNRDVTIDAVYNRFDETGRIAAFRCDWKDGMPYRPHIFWDSDVAKWMEGAAYQLSRDDNPALRAKVESLIDEIEKNQHPDGYFNIYYTVVDPAHRFTNRDNHELYCAGHLIEAAVAYHDAVGDTRFLGLMEKYARYIKSVFMDDTGDVVPQFATPGHEELEIALVKLWHATGEAEYLDLAAFFIDRRGYGDRGEPLDTSNQSHMPLREQRSVVGHSVRAGYIYAAMADLAREKNDAALDEACCALFEDMAYRKMYVTGGLGSTNVGEAFTIPYDLSNDKAYAETCASIAMILFAHRMFLLHHASKYADVVELELYNGMLSGLSLSGDAFFYENPLEIHLDNYKKQGGRYPITQRRKVFDCSCCPCNINRVLASVGQYFYAEENGAVWISQFGTSEYRSDACMVSQKTDYPVSGKIEIMASCPVYVRIPGVVPLLHGKRALRDGIRLREICFGRDHGTTGAGAGVSGIARGGIQECGQGIPPSRAGDLLCGGDRQRRRCTFPLCKRLRPCVRACRFGSGDRHSGHCGIRLSAAQRGSVDGQRAPALRAPDRSGKICLHGDPLHPLPRLCQPRRIQHARLAALSCLTLRAGGTGNEGNGRF